MSAYSASKERDGAMIFQLRYFSCFCRSLWSPIYHEIVKPLRIPSEFQFSQARHNPMITIVTRLPTTITTRRTTPEWSKGALRRGGRLLVDRSWEGLSNVGWWDLSYIHISHCSEVFFCNELSIMSARWSGWCCEECWHRGTDPVTTRSSAIFSKYCDSDLTLSSSSLSKSSHRLPSLSAKCSSFWLGLPQVRWWWRRRQCWGLGGWWRFCWW